MRIAPFSRESLESRALSEELNRFTSKRKQANKVQIELSRGQQEQQQSRSIMVDSALKQSRNSSDAGITAGITGQKSRHSQRSRHLQSQEEASICAFKTNGHDLSLGVVGFTQDSNEPVVKIANLLHLNAEPVDPSLSFNLQAGRNSSLLDISSFA